MKCKPRETVFLVLIVFIAVFLSSSCSTTIPGVRPQQDISGGISMTRPLNIPMPFVGDVYHTVAPGETLWRIGKMYDVDPESIKIANKIKDVKDIDIGRRLLIPGASARQNVITLYPSKKWKYIIVHHSATESGSSEQFNIMHKNKGWDGVGYHFVIDNGSYGKDEGQIETTPRWIKQENGAHCKAGDMNEKGIGICLVGNFSNDNISPKQMESLVYLVVKLQEYYRIPKSKVIGHGQVRGASTECPGTRFPWKTFYSKIK